MTKVLVTGASGFIAKHIIRELLAANYEVRGTIRSAKRKAEVEALFPNADIEFATVDLSKDDGWDEALAGVDVLMHTASPFPADAPDDPMQIIRPAVDGTMRALNAAQKAGVTRVIVTSSCVAIYKDPTHTSGGPSSEANWTDPDAPIVSAYEASKTLAERAAWDFVGKHPEMKLTSINPGAVFGPAMDSNYGTSLELVERFLEAKDPMYPNMNLPAVDVRDVARMHVNAITNDATIGERFAASAGPITMVEGAGILAEAYPDRKIKTRTAPNWLLKIAARFDPLVKQAVGNLGRNLAVNGSKAERIMGFTYITPKDSILASARFLVDNGK